MTSIHSGVIYGLSCACHPDREIRYVGQTTQPLSSRVSEHRYKASMGDGRPLSCWIRKHGPDNVVSKALEHVSEGDSIDEREVWWIARLGTFGGGLNLNVGGASNRGFRHSSETIAKMRERTYSAETRAKMRESALRRVARDGAPVARSPKGSLSGNAKLSEAQVAIIKRRLIEGARLSTLAGEYGVTKGTIWKIKYDRAWRHVPWPMADFAR